MTHPRTTREPLRVFSLILLLHALVLPSCTAGIVGGVVLPHGDFAFDPSLVRGKNGSMQLHNASFEAGKWLISLSPDVVIIVTPHGMELSTDYLIYQNTELSGCAELGGDLHNSTFPTYKVCRNLSTDSAAADLIVFKAREAGLPVTGIKGFANSLPLPISWGEILPFEYLNSSKPKVVILSVPYSRYNHSTDMVPTLVQLGREIGFILEGDKKRYGMVISADLAHTHEASGPYGFCECAEPFDTSVALWAKSMKSTYLREQARKEQELGAKSCGFPGLVLFDGVLDIFRNIRTFYWESELLECFHPTYYGMLVARFGPRIKLDVRCS